MSGSIHPLSIVCVHSSLHSCIPHPLRNQVSCTKIIALVWSPPSFLFFFLTQDGDGCHSGIWHMCGCGRKPAAASVTVLFLKLSKSLMPVVGFTQAGLLDRAYDGREVNESIQTSKGLETNSSDPHSIFQCQNRAPLDGAEDKEM